MIWQGRYWQITNHRVLVAWKDIKMGCINTVSYVYSISQEVS